MSQENVEATKRANAALNRGDFDGVVEVFAADAVLQDLQNAPDQPVTVEGIRTIRQIPSLWAAAFDELRVDIEECIDGPKAVTCAAHWQGRARRAALRTQRSPRRPSRGLPRIHADAIRGVNGASASLGRTCCSRPSLSQRP